MADKAAIQINLRELKELATALNAAQPELAKEVKTALVAGGKKVALDASRHAWAFSSRIPGSIKVRTNGFTVSIVAGSKDAPHAAPFEHHGTPGDFRHPVFGNRDVWVAQKAHPFLAPVFFSKQDDIVHGVVSALDVIFEKAGFR